MGAGEAIFLGLVQGLTEFLPVSSSAHLRIVGELLGSGDPGAAFTAITQLGTESAVLLYFRRDIARICRAWWSAVRGDRGTDLRARMGMPAGERADHDALMAWFIALGSVPIVLLGLLFQDAIERPFRNLWLIVLTLAGFALVLGWADRRAVQQRTLDDLTPRDALKFGLWQSLALVPGVSRSGGTITGGLLMGYTREAAARYSFLLAIPAVFGSGLFQLAKSVGDFGEAGTPSFGATLLATLVAFVVGYLVIIVFLKIVSTFSYKPFVVYRLGLAALVALLLVTNVLEPLPAVTP
ncbi:undecaprenyl-diphosphate phosphatase [Cellulomonas fimi]|uniref:Undecaprenyl-diphosphatase n=1 Tax=Cellulomonas fimi (strain ATCC 484 / DSM 20113 / JCM 1341 / CCUG 24087 / LMG 16345 / NBRC 15513 / NCIMB 8980 / NCTC 7547 / NRS-133) TaxID=590998 RepID=F4GYC0_CELFA|nr:undecaprenyl-diphosphate phosphatase [Cellulomonas fimi]AEE45909.1 undecaprenol kinase [Cellulomonas fimi ATCC 484]NNH06764.1 undecaprenyl-diphosphate phosphatase [Cellulomonas fimi]VEH30967.1 Undecaprenyl-diphosphatase [Cellulomonas fimi]